MTSHQNNEESADNSALLSPPKQLKIRKTVEGMTITYRTFSLIAVVMFIAAVFGSVYLWKEPFHLVHTLIWFIAAQSLFFLFAKKVITITPGKGSYFSGIGAIGITKHFSLNEKTTCREKEIRGRNSRSQSTYGLDIANPGEKTVTIGGFWDSDIPCYLESLLDQLKQ